MVWGGAFLSENILTLTCCRFPQAQVLSTALCPLAWVLRIFYSQHLHEFAAAAGHPLQVSAAAEHDTLDEDIPDMVRNCEASTSLVRS